MKTIAVGEFKAKCLALVEEVRSRGERVLITKRGEPVAEVIPIRPRKSIKDHELRGSVIYEGDLLSPIDVEWEAMK